MKWRPVDVILKSFLPKINKLSMSEAIYFVDEANQRFLQNKTWIFFVFGDRIKLLRKPDAQKYKLSFHSLYPFSFRAECLLAQLKKELNHSI